MNVRDMRLHRLCIGEIASAFPGDVEFFSDLIVLFKKVNFRSVLGCLDRRQATGRPATDHSNYGFLHRYFVLHSYY